MPFLNFVAGWSSLVARQAHNLKAVGSNPAPATKLVNTSSQISKNLDCYKNNQVLCNILDKKEQFVLF